MPFTSETARAARARQTPETNRDRGAKRWTPDARVREAIRVLVDQAATLTNEQRAQLAPLVLDTARGADA